MVVDLLPLSDTVTGSHPPHHTNEPKGILAHFKLNSQLITSDLNSKWYFVIDGLVRIEVGVDRWLTDHGRRREERARKNNCHLSIA